ncbi:MAG: choice-of-anchor tandem repeat GloVer-containing protein, partial [Candidatus Korobacteraceae bacterium]
GAHGYGSVFKLSPSANGWIYNDLYDFTGGSDGANPVSNVVIDAQGNLYGTASNGGDNSKCVREYNRGCGTVWEITP